MARRAVVVGGGITGSLTAFRLARRGWAVTLLEARHVGAGSSSRTAAGIRQQFSTPETVVGMRYSVDFYRRYTEEVGGTTSPIVQNGYLFLYATQEDWDAARARVRVQRAAGLDEVEALDVADLPTRFPWVDRHAVLGATWCPTDGFLRPETVYNEAIAAARALGAAVVQGAEVVGAVHTNGAIDALRTSAGDFPADIVVDATNAWTRRLAPRLGGVALPVTARKRYLWILERAGALTGAELARFPLTIAPSGAYCRPENDSAMLAGWAHDAPDEPDFSWEDQDRVEPAFYHRGGPDTAGFEAWAALAEVIPPLAEFGGISATTSGYYGVTPDHNPFLGFDPAVPNLVRLVGFSGHGAMFGPFSALIAEALCEAGQDVATVNAMGRDVSVAAFGLRRDFRRGEAMVI